MARKHPKIGIALGGGGAKGLAHIGVLKVLEEHGITIEYVSGCSIGSLIGAYFAAHPTIGKLEELILSFNKRKIFMLFDPILRGGLIKGNKVEKFIAEILEAESFKDLNIPFSAIATDLSTGKEVVLSDGDLVKAVRASISVPAVFRPVEYHGKLLADGGLSDPVPVDVVRANGCDIVIAVNVESTYFSQKLLAPLPLSKTPMHSINVLRHNLTLKALKNADVVVAPKIAPVGLIGWDYFFNNEKAKKLMKAGEDAMREAMPQLEHLIAKKQREKHGLRKFFSFFKRFR